MNKTKIFRAILVIGGLYYAIGAVCHLFGLTFFPFYDGRLYSQYHDIVISIAAIFISMCFFIVAKDPVKNIDLLNIIIIFGFVGIIFSIGII